MPERNTPQKTLESWKQIAAYLERSERTVRRWEASECLPVHRRGHQKYDTVFAYKHEIEAWARRRTRFGSQDAAVPGPEGHEPPPSEVPANRYLIEHDAITRTMDRYVAGARAGDGDLMRPAFHREATMSGYWVSFAATGDPNGGGRPAWPCFDGRQAMHFGDEIGLGPVPRRAHLAFWDAYYERRRTASAQHTDRGEREDG